MPDFPHFLEKVSQASEELALDDPAYLRHMTHIPPLGKDEWERDPVESVGIPREVSISRTEWARQSPLKEGYYFIRMRHDPHLISLVEVFVSPTFPYRLCYRTLGGESVYKEYVTIPLVDWAGPVQLPEDKETST